MEKKLQKLYHTYYNLLIVQDLWKAHYQILLIIYLKDFIELNVNTNMTLKNMKHIKLNKTIVTVLFLNTQISKSI